VFTGLIEEVGILKRSHQQGEAMRMTIGASLIMSDVRIGDSIAVNGVCLTVTAFSPQQFSVDVTPQTYRFSTLSKLRPGEPVNLERAMQAGGRFGGHIVQGHVDGVGTIISRAAEANMIVFTIEPADPGLMRYIIPQGSVTLDGISLTVSSCEANRFTVSIIPHTLDVTVLHQKQGGASLNIECDVLGKYVDHLLHYRGAAPQSSGEGTAASGAGTRSALTPDFLARHGFL